jgi:hypothetical protein
VRPRGPGRCEELLALAPAAPDPVTEWRLLGIDTAAVGPGQIVSG